MSFRRSATLVIIAGLVTPAALVARQNIVLNGSLELGGGPGAVDPMVAAEWVEFGVNVERSAAFSLVPPDEGHSLKVFGDGDNNNAGASQQVADVLAGQTIVATVWLYSPADDKLRGSGEAGLVLEFLDFFGGTIALHETYVMDASAPADTWVLAELGPLTAPEDTTQVRVACRLQWVPGDVLGAAYWDDAQLTVDGGANLLLNGDFETAGTSGHSPFGIDDWVGFEDQEKSEDVAEHGVASVRLGTGAAYSGLWQNMAVLTEGDHIRMLAYAWNPSDDPLTGSSRVGIKLEFDPNVDVPPPVEYIPFDETVAPDEWVLVELDTEVPPDISFARIVCIYIGDPQTTGAVHFDLARAERDSAPGDNQLLNPSFETGPGGYQGLDDWTEFSSSGVSQAQKSCFEVTTPEGGGICTMRAAGEAVAGVFQDIPVVPGEGLHVEALLLTPDFEPLTGTGRAGMKVEWVVGGVPDDIDIGGADNTIDADAPQDTWLPLTIDYVMPAESSALARFVNLIEKGTGLTGTVYMDSCEAVLLNRFDGADVDGDDDEDLRDFAWLQYCFSGSGGPLKYNGIVFDADDDEDVDFADFEYFAPRMTGP